MGGLEVSITEELNNNPDFRGILRFPEGITAKEGTKRLYLREEEIQLPIEEITLSKKERKLSEEEQEKIIEEKRKSTKKIYDNIETKIYTFKITQNNNQIRRKELFEIDLKEISLKLKKDYEILKTIAPKNYESLLPEEIVSARAATRTITQKKNEIQKYNIKLSTNVINILSNDNVKKVSKINKGEKAYFRIKENILLLGANGKSIKAAQEIKKDLKSIPFEHWRNHLEEEFDLTKIINTVLARKPKPEKVIKPKKEESQGEIYKGLYRVENLTLKIKEKLDRNYDNLSKKISFLTEFLKSPLLYDEKQTKKAQESYNTIIKIGKNLNEKFEVNYSKKINQTLNNYNSYLAAKKEIKRQQKSEANKRSKIRSKEKKIRKSLEDKIKKLNFKSAKSVIEQKTALKSIKSKISQLKSEQYKKQLLTDLDYKINLSIHEVISKPLFELQDRLNQCGSLNNYEELYSGFEKYYDLASRALSVFGMEEEIIIEDKVYADLFFEFDTYKYVKKALNFASQINSVKQLENDRANPKYLLALNKLLKLKDKVRRRPKKDHARSELDTKFYQLILDEIPFALTSYIEKKKTLFEQSIRASTLENIEIILEESEELTRASKLLFNRIKDTKDYKQKLPLITKINQKITYSISKDELSKIRELDKIRLQIMKNNDEKQYNHQIFTNYVDNLLNASKNPDLIKRFNVNFESELIEEQLSIWLDSILKINEQDKTYQKLMKNEESIENIKQLPLSENLELKISNIEKFMKKETENSEKPLMKVQIIAYERGISLEKLTNYFSRSPFQHGISESNGGSVIDVIKKNSAFNFLTLEQNNNPDENGLVGYTFRFFKTKEDSQNYIPKIFLQKTPEIDLEGEVIYHIKIQSIGEQGLYTEQEIVEMDIAKLSRLVSFYKPSSIDFELKRNTSLNTMREEENEKLLKKAGMILKPLLDNWKFLDIGEVPITLSYSTKKLFQDKVSEFYNSSKV